ncbi:MAG TPA: hypothetical protein VFS67_36310 [Polyangiaceae bacterium]|jgi:hypothetical protein|nr:hypothetical protein [Polyangiaceae bacterium]
MSEGQCSPRAPLRGGDRRSAEASAVTGAALRVDGGVVRSIA